MWNINFYYKKLIGEDLTGKRKGNAIQRYKEKVDKKTPKKLFL